MILEVRTYRVVPGGASELVRRLRAVLPLLERHAISVVALGESLVHEDGEFVYLVRQFHHLEERRTLEEAFYSSTEWRRSYRAGILELIEDFHTVVLAKSDLFEGPSLSDLNQP